MLSPVYIRFDKPSISLAAISEVCEHYKVPFYDYTTCAEFLNNPSLFQDRSHMNDKGATIYSEKVAKEIKNGLK